MSNFQFLKNGWYEFFQRGINKVKLGVQHRMHNEKFKNFSGCDQFTWIFHNHKKCHC